MGRSGRGTRQPMVRLYHGGRGRASPGRWKRLSGSPRLRRIRLRAALRSVECGRLGDSGAPSAPGDGQSIAGRGKSRKGVPCGRDEEGCPSAVACPGPGGIRRRSGSRYRPTATPGGMNIGAREKVKRNGRRAGGRSDGGRRSPAAGAFRRIPVLKPEGKRCCAAESALWRAVTKEARRDAGPFALFCLGDCGRSGEKGPKAG